MQLVLRQPFPEKDAREPLASWPLTLFIMLASGFVTSELTAESSIAQAAFVWIPEHIADILRLSHYLGWLEGIWALVLFPAVLWLLLGGMIALFRRTSIGDAWRRLALPIAVIVSAAHMSKALAKFTSWAGFFPHALTDPLGTKTAMDIASHAVPSPEPLVNIHVASGIAFGLLLVGTLLALREVRLANPTYLRVHAAPKFALAGLFVIIIMAWG